MAWTALAFESAMYFVFTGAQRHRNVPSRPGIPDDWRHIQRAEPVRARRDAAHEALALEIRFRARHQIPRLRKIKSASMNLGIRVLPSRRLHFGLGINSRQARDRCRRCSPDAVLCNDASAST